MKVPELLELMRNKLATLQSQREEAFATGAVDGVVNLDAQIVETQETINQLSTLVAPSPSGE